MEKILNQGGLITALLTPLKNNKLDLLSFERIIELQLADNGADSILLFGTTGEPHSLTASEKRILFFTAKEIVKYKIPIIAGVADIATNKALLTALTYRKWNADGLLVITPYYYKVTNKGLYSHFYTIAKNTNLPIILYNVPKRTGLDISQNKSLIKSLALIKNIIGIKQSSSDIKTFKNLINIDNFKVFCGNDEAIEEQVNNGACGAISVASNVCPTAIKNLLTASKNGSGVTINTKQFFNQLFELLALEPNPITIKYFASKIIGISNELRLPHTTCEQKNKDLIDKFIYKNKEAIK